MGGKKSKSNKKSPAMAEEKNISTSDAEPKSIRREKTKGSEVGSKFDPQWQKTKAKLHPQRRKIKTKITLDSSMFQMCLRAVIKLDQRVDYFRYQKKKINPMGSSIQS